MELCEKCGATLGPRVPAIVIDLGLSGYVVACPQCGNIYHHPSSPKDDAPTSDMETHE